MPCNPSVYQVYLPVIIRSLQPALKMYGKESNRMCRFIYYGAGWRCNAGFGICPHCNVLVNSTLLCIGL